MRNKCEKVSTMEVFLCSSKCFKRNQSPRWPQKGILMPVKPKIFRIKWYLKPMYTVLVQQGKKIEKIKSARKYMAFMISPYFIRNKSSSFSNTYQVLDFWLLKISIIHLRNKSSSKHNLQKNIMQKLKLKYIQFISSGVIFMKYAVIQLSQTYSAAFFFTVQWVNPHNKSS